MFDFEFNKWILIEKILFLIFYGIWFKKFVFGRLLVIYFKFNIYIVYFNLDI